MEREALATALGVAVLVGLSGCGSAEAPPLTVDVFEVQPFDGWEVAGEPDIVAKDTTQQPDGPTSDTSDDVPDVTVDVPGDADRDAEDADVEVDADVPPLPPEGGATLEAWLVDGHYLDWPAESAPHASAGPHFGKVRTFVNPLLHASLEAGATAHPEGAAAVKELYGGGGTVLGWAVAAKRSPASALGQGWQWYERYQGTTHADGLGESLCTGCHSGGKDFILTPFPLQ